MHYICMSDNRDKAEGTGGKDEDRERRVGEEGG